MEQHDHDSMPVGALVRSSPVLQPGDSIAKAAGALRRSTFDIVPVIENGHVTGLVSEESLRGSNGQAEMPPKTTADVMERLVTTMPAYVTPHVALEVLAASNADTMPVVDYSGIYRGMVSRSGIIQGLAGKVPPQRVGGMATPLGVYLTSGSARGGVGDLGLFLAGVALFGCMAVGLAVVFGAAWLTRPDLAVDLAYSLLRTDAGPPPWAIAAAALVVGLLFRASPLAGYHAAEHQVVHAIEQGEDLTAERVAAMPRVHPRCGTNLVVVGVTASALVVLGGGSVNTVMAAVIIALLFRFSLGSIVQHFITTRPAHPEELASGIRAGEQLVARHQSALNTRTRLGRRIWAMGLIQVAAGMMVPTWIASYVMNAAGTHLFP